MGPAHGTFEDRRPLYYVGTAGLSSFLFATGEGHILFNTGLPDSGPLIVESIKKLGFDPTDIKILINGHGHSDHAGAFAYFKKLTGASLPSRSIACCETATPCGWGRSGSLPT